MNKLDITNKIFHRLKAIKFIKTNKYGNSIWLFECCCKNKTLKELVAYRVKNGIIKSCGCLRNESLIKRRKTHGKSNHRLYNIWCGMKGRCYCIKHTRYKDYGRKNITLCDEWKSHFEKFYNWAINHGYKDELTIDRINNDDIYRPENCRWVNYKKQANNKRNNHLITFNNKTQNITEWAEELSIERRKLNWYINKEYTLNEIVNMTKLIGFDGKKYNLSLIDRVNNNASEYHKKARNLLKNIFPLEKIYEEVCLYGSNTIKNRQLFADFFIPSLKIIIEVNGQQHDNFIKHWHKNKYNYFKAKQRDSIKRDWCELNNITLIELPYNETEDEWECRIKNR